MAPRFRIALLIALSAAAFSTAARTLFIDLNNAPQEIAALKQWSRDEIVVVPSLARIDAGARARALAAAARLDRLAGTSRHCGEGTAESSDACAAIYERIRAAELAREDATSHYTEDDLYTELGSLVERASGRPFDMLVISGHHENGAFRGELAQLDFNNFTRQVAALPELFAHINTVVLLGCETGTRAMFIDKLAPTFPNVAVIVGAGGTAPTRTDARNLAFIRNLVKSRSALLTARTQPEAQSAFARIRTRKWPASLLWRQQALFIGRKVEIFSARETPRSPFAIDAALLKTSTGAGTRTAVSQPAR
jgi:hypothetical protein